MAEPFLGQIVLFAGFYVPTGWALCDGHAINIADNPPLYALIGTTYGGNNTTFNLPDLRGRAPVGTGSVPEGSTTVIPIKRTGVLESSEPGVPGVPNIPSGQTGGSNQIVLIPDNLPSHSHSLAVSSAPGNSADPTGKL